MGAPRSRSRPRRSRTPAASGPAAPALPLPRSHSWLAALLVAAVGAVLRQVPERRRALARTTSRFLRRPHPGDQRGALVRERFACRQVGGAIEVLAALDPGLLARRVGRQRAPVPDREVGVL